MIFLPVVERELRVSSRRSLTYWTRFIGALMAIGISVWIWFATGANERNAQLSTTLFYTLGILAFAYSLTAGITVTADCMSEEKREGTFGLLFLTDLKGYDIVLGKLAATSLNCCYGLLAIFPVLAVPLLLGGLTVGEFWRIVLVLTNTLFFSLSAGILVSAVSYHERKALAGSLVLILSVALLSPIVGLIVAYQQSPFAYPRQFLLPSAGYTFYMAVDANFKLLPLHYWLSLGLTHATGWIFLMIASLVAPYSWQDRAVGGTQTGWKEAWRRVKYGVGEVRDSFRARLLDINPILWLVSRDRLKPVYVLGFLALAACAWLWLFWQYRRDMLDSASYVATAILVHAAIKVWLASEACRPFAQDRRSGTLELVLSTPLSVDEILWGQLWAFQRQFGPAVGIILLVDLVMIVAGANDRLLDSPNSWLLMCAAGIIVLIADLFTVAWVGMWLGLISKKANWASSGTIFRVLALPWLIFFGYMTVSMFASIGRFNSPMDSVLGAWFIIALVNDLFFYGLARGRLRHELRTIATQRFDSKKGGAFWPATQEETPAIVQPVAREAVES